MNPHLSLVVFHVNNLDFWQILRSYSKLCCIIHKWNAFCIYISYFAGLRHAQRAKRESVRGEPVHALLSASRLCRSCRWAHTIQAFRSSAWWKLGSKDSQRTCLLSPASRPHSGTETSLLLQMKINCGEFVILTALMNASHLMFPENPWFY